MSVDPATPMAGRPARVAVQTVFIYGATCVDDPRADVRPAVLGTPGVRDDTLQLVATGPAGTEEIPFRVPGLAADPTRWEGTVTLPAPGQWTLRMVRPSWPGDRSGGRCSGSAIEVTVLPADRSLASWAEDGRAIGLAAAVAALGGFVALGAFGTRHLRRRRASEGQVS
ncbi:MAG: hypothetical protein ACRDI2_05930 [Chloroflexota bacterium]